MELGIGVEGRLLPDDVRVTGLVQIVPAYSIEGYGGRTTEELKVVEYMVKE